MRGIRVCLKIYSPGCSTGSSERFSWVRSEESSDLGCQQCRLNCKVAPGKSQVIQHHRSNEVESIGFVGSHVLRRAGSTTVETSPADETYCAVTVIDGASESKNRLRLRQQAVRKNVRATLAYRHPSIINLEGEDDLRNRN